MDCLMTPPQPPFIVAEVSKNWIDGTELSTEYGTLSERFQRILEINRERGYRLTTFTLDRMMVGPNALNETIIAVFERMDREPDLRTG